MDKMLFVFTKDSLERTPQGFLKVKARANRTGIQTYVINGKLVKRFRPKEQVFSSDSLETLKNAPLTVGHPKEAVTLNNISVYGVGHTTEYIKIVKDGEEDFCEVELLITDANTIDKIESNELTELSCGYTNDIVKQTGTYKEETYDEIQTNIIYNHIALLPTGTARAGRKARIKLVNDSLEMIYDSLDENILINDKKEVKKTMKIKINGVEFEVDDIVGQSINNQLTKDSNSILELQNQVTEKESKIAELTGKITVLDSEIKNQPDINTVLNERSAFFEKAKPLIKDSSVINLTMDSVEVMKAVVKERLPHLTLDEKIDKNELKGMFNALTPLTNDKENNFFKTMQNATKEFAKDSKDKKETTLSPREKYLNDLKNASKGAKV